MVGKVGSEGAVVSPANEDAYSKTAKSSSKSDTAAAPSGRINWSDSVDDALEVINDAVNNGIELTPQQSETLSKARHLLEAGFPQFALSMVNGVASDVSAQMIALGNVQGKDADQLEKQDEELKKDKDSIKEELVQFVNEEMPLDDPEHIGALLTYLEASGMFNEAELNQLRAIEQNYESGEIDRGYSDDLELAEYNKVIVGAMSRMHDEASAKGEAPLFSEGFIADFERASVIQNATASLIVYRDAMFNPAVMTDDKKMNDAMVQFEFAKNLFNTYNAARQSAAS